MSDKQGFKGDLKQGIFNAKNENLKALEALFPSAVKDGQLDVEALREELGQFEEVGSEKYGLTWSGKQNAKKIALEDSIGKTLKFVPEESVNLDTTENLYIEGDNLEVLKLLRQNYYGAIKMIYIDPPYNTGNDFVYRDKFNMGSVESDMAEGVMTEEKERLQRNLKSTNRFHANWLNMMYPRLKVAKDLLSEDGVIFISIDDNEVADLHKLCDEIFGEENFIAEFIWKSKLGKVGTTSTISSIHEYILCFSKNIQQVSFKMIESQTEGRKENLRQWGQADRREDRPSMFYPIHIDGMDVYPIKEDNTEGRWRVGEETARDLLARGQLEVQKKGDIYNIYRYFEAGVSTIPYDTLLLNEIGTTAKGSIILKGLGMNKIFDYSKPVELIYFFANLVNDQQMIVLDFFSGSSTTAHAIMQLNVNDGGNRKFIMVQIPELCDDHSEAKKAGYNTICEIGKERIRRAGNKIKEELEETNANQQMEDTQKTIPDIGFKVFKTADTMIRWNYEDIQLQRAYLQEVAATTSEVLEGQALVGANMMSHKDQLDFMPYATDIDVVYEILLRQRDIPLSASIRELEDIGRRTYLFDESFLVCLETEITIELIEKITAIRPLPIKFIFRDSAFEDDVNLKDETIRLFKALVARNTNKKQSAYTVEFI